MRSLSPIVAALFGCLTSVAQGQSMLPVVGSDEPLRALTTVEDARGWGAIGRLESRVSFCSATLIAADLILTAAHCVFDPETGQRFAAEDLLFAAGLRNGRAVASRSAQRTIVLPSYRPGEGEGLEMIGQDIALVELASAINDPGIVPLQTGIGLERDDTVTIVSYGRDREDHASIEEGCQVLDRSGNVRSLDCSIVPGSSGAPVMQMRSGIPRIVAVVSAVGEVRGDEVALVVALDQQLALLMNQRISSGGFSASRGDTTVFGQTASDRNMVGGARFIRP